MRYAGLAANILLSGSWFVIVHIVMFCGLLFRPQQSVDVVVPGSALNPAGQFVQADAELLENVSAGHVEHAAGPETLLAVPAAHATHGPPFGPVYLGLHRQAVIFVLVDGEFELLGHAVHAAVLVLSLYVPIPQAVHGPLVGPAYP
jgi:hypothetical protein